MTLTFKQFMEGKGQLQSGKDVASTAKPPPSPSPSSSSGNFMSKMASSGALGDAAKSSIQPGGNNSLGVKSAATSAGGGKYFTNNARLLARAPAQFTRGTVPDAKFDASGKSRFQKGIGEFAPKTGTTSSALPSASTTNTVKPNSSTSQTRVASKPSTKNVGGKKRIVDDASKDITKFINEKSAAWTRKAGKNKEGGLNEKGRKSYERENPGSDLKAPSKKVGNPRRASFCARMRGMKKKLTSKKTARDPDSRINKSLRAWNC